MCEIYFEDIKHVFKKTKMEKNTPKQTFSLYFLGRDFKN